MCNLVIEKDIITSFQQVRQLDYGARFYRSDLHFHTPASEDARGRNKYNFNPYKITFPLKRDNSLVYLQEVKKIQDRILSDSRKVAQRIVKKFLEERLGLVAISDHNGIGTIWNDPETPKNSMDLAAPTWYELIDDEARKVNEKEGKAVLTILPGVEISTTDIHILAVFPPQEPRRKVHFLICNLLHEVGFEVDEWGKNPKAGKTSVYNTIELIIKAGGLPIIAHVDAHEKALLKLYDIKGAAMKNVLTNKHLLALEIIKPSNFSKKNKEVGETLSKWIKTQRKKKGLASFAYFQGSDAHAIKDIAKRSTYVKMTEPSFSGLKISVNIPSSRVRLYNDLQLQQRDGLYIYGIKFNNKIFKECLIRFNRHLNCVVGKKDCGKSFFFKSMMKLVNPDSPDIELQGTVKLFLEKVVKSQSRYYVITNDRKNHSLYAINNDRKSVEKLDWGQLENLKIRPRFYSSKAADLLIDSNKKFNEFLIKRFGPVSEENVKAFNEMFSLHNFLEEKDRPLLFGEGKGNDYKIYLDINWNKGKTKKVEFSKLDRSLRRTILACIIIISGKTGPLIMDAPEHYFDNEDIVDFLVPVMKKYKDFRQIILFTNHPILSINPDPENFILIERKGTGNSIVVETGFSIDKKEHKDRLVRVLEGNPLAFKKRLVRYGFEF